MTKTEAQIRKEYETKLDKLEIQFKKRSKTAVEKQKKISNLVDKLYREYMSTQDANRKKYYRDKKKRQYFKNEKAKRSR